MGRSVSTHRNAVETFFIAFEVEPGDEDFAWDDFIEDLSDNVLCAKYPSLSRCDRWQGREDHIILENSQVEISVSEYCGLVAVCLAPLNPDNAFHVTIAERMSKGFRNTLHKAFPKSSLQSIGRASNGEQFFQTI
jgi:hypothetical protein